jgi:hypothetical protein
MDFYLNFTVNHDPGASWTPFTSNDPRVLQLEIGNVTLIADTLRLDQTTFINSAEVMNEAER